MEQLKTKKDWVGVALLGVINASLLVLGLLMITSCGTVVTSPIVTFQQTAYSVESLYNTTAQIETTAMASGLVSDADKANIKRLDNIAYGDVTLLRNLAENGTLPSSTQIAQATADIGALSSFLAGKGFK